MRGAVLGPLFVFFVAMGCTCGLRYCTLSPHVVDGVLDAPSPVHTLVAGHEACAYSLQWQAPLFRKKDTSHAWARTRRWEYAPGAKLTVDGRVYEILGHQASFYEGYLVSSIRTNGNPWSTHPQLHGFSGGLDTIMQEIDAGMNVHSYVRVRDSYVPCDRIVKMKAYLVDGYAISFTRYDHLDQILAEHDLPPRKD